MMSFRHYSPNTYNSESGAKSNIVIWMLASDDANHPLFPSRVFFLMAGAKDRCANMAKNLKTKIDEENTEAFKSTTSLLFDTSQAEAVKMIDDRNIENLRVLEV